MQGHHVETDCMATMKRTGWEGLYFCRSSGNLTQLELRVAKYETKKSTRLSSAAHCVSAPLAGWRSKATATERRKDYLASAVRQSSPS